MNTFGNGPIYPQRVLSPYLLIQLSMSDFPFPPHQSMYSIFSDWGRWCRLDELMWMNSAWLLSSYKARIVAVVRIKLNGCVRSEGCKSEPGSKGTKTLWANVMSDNSIPNHCISQCPHPLPDDICGQHCSHVSGIGTECWCRLAYECTRTKGWGRTHKLAPSPQSHCALREGVCRAWRQFM